MMHPLQKFLLVHAVAHLVQNALGNDIINGELVPEGEMAYMASLQDSSGHHVCGGFLIREDFVLTAAHCKWNNPVRVVLGSHSLSSNSKIVKSIEKIYIHPFFDGKVFHGNDIMLLKLSIEVNLGRNVQLITLAQSGTNIKAGQRCQVAGWGKTSTSGAMVNDLRRVDVSVLNRQECMKKWGNLSPDAICAGGNSIYGFCQGDSGGPLICDGTCVGTVSFNRERYCGYPDRPNVYVNIAKHLMWINNTLKSKTGL